MRGGHFPLTDCVRTGDTIDEGFWPGICGAKSVPHDPVRGGFPGHQDSARTADTIDLERSGIRVASYWTEVLPKKELEEKLHKAVLLARARLEKGENL